MNFKKIALAAAAAAAATPAMAADLPVVAEPVNYVEACSAYGDGYFKLPGQDTCIRVHGRIRTNFVSHDLNDGLGDVTNQDEVDADLTGETEAETNDYSAYARGYLYFESMTTTEFATIETYTAFLANHDQDGNDTVIIDDVYLQLGFNSGSLLIGDTLSQFDSFTGYTWIAPVSENFSEQYPLLIAYTADLGNGLSLTGSLEDSTERGGANNRADFVGALSVSQGWGNAKFSAAAHAYDGDDYGYALSGSVTITAMEGIEATFQAQYANRAIDYIGGAANSGFTDAGDVSGFNIGGGFQGDLSDTVSAQLDWSYLSLDQGSADYDRTAIDASLVYSPVAGLAFAVAAGWADDSNDNDEAKVGARIQYTF
ncbi:putative outer membrane protein y4fJ precursor [Pseudovibrio axinellae]|uniref:Porin n=1 Tax=Pseudovibrio axinellae TaxID=989403 RepID=A0A165WQ79_9HYPH|nr:porin [Pseudovibrio axinellae]KZL16785.1 putative outer membrane protein y4fJ precursor [Pseudovibrio axinellae]SEQ74706.1 Porin subfamily protein [Pseudovibrio axinellae]